MSNDRTPVYVNHWVDFLQDLKRVAVVEYDGRFLGYLCIYLTYTLAYEPDVLGVVKHYTNLTVWGYPKDGTGIIAANDEILYTYFIVKYTPLSLHLNPIPYFLYNDEFSDDYY